MSGMAMVVTGGVLIAVSTIGMAAAEWLIYRKKGRIREQVYHIYR